MKEIITVFVSLKWKIVGGARIFGAQHHLLYVHVICDCVSSAKGGSISSV